MLRVLHSLPVLLLDALRLEPGPRRERYHAPRTFNAGAVEISRQARAVAAGAAFSLAALAAAHLLNARHATHIGYVGFRPTNHFLAYLDGSVIVAIDAGNHFLTNKRGGLAGAGETRRA